LTAHLTDIYLPLIRFINYSPKEINALPPLVRLVVEDGIEALSIEEVLDRLDFSTAASRKGKGSPVSSREALMLEPGYESERNLISWRMNNLEKGQLNGVPIDNRYITLMQYWATANLLPQLDDAHLLAAVKGGCLSTRDIEIDDELAPRLCSPPILNELLPSEISQINQTGNGQAALDQAVIHMHGFAIEQTLGALTERQISRIPLDMFVVLSDEVILRNLPRLTTEQIDHIGASLIHAGIMYECVKESNSRSLLTKNLTSAESDSGSVRLRPGLSTVITAMRHKDD
jgi:hypothetical protein